MLIIIRELKKVLEERERKETIKRLLHKKALTKKWLEVKILSPSSSLEDELMPKWNATIFNMTLIIEPV